MVTGKESPLPTREPHFYSLFGEEEDNWQYNERTRQFEAVLFPSKSAPRSNTPNAAAAKTKQAEETACAIANLSSRLEGAAQRRQRFA